jgi:septal ring factor EnvC (AmiA/AmiB activator)
MIIAAIKYLASSLFLLLMLNSKAWLGPFLKDKGVPDWFNNDSFFIIITVFAVIINIGVMSLLSPKTEASKSAIEKAKRLESRKNSKQLKSKEEEIEKLKEQSARQQSELSRQKNEIEKKTDEILKKEINIDFLLSKLHENTETTNKFKTNKFEIEAEESIQQKYSENQFRASKTAL